MKTLEELSEHIGEILVSAFRIELSKSAGRMNIEGLDYKESNLYKLAYSKSDGDMTWTLYANHYYKYLDTGRKPLITKVPFGPLLAWVKRKGIDKKFGLSANATAWKIRESIYKKGIKPRNYVNPAIDLSVKTIGTLIDEQFIATIYYPFYLAFYN
jgi:hypothetical protein